MESNKKNRNEMNGRKKIGSRLRSAIMSSVGWWVFFPVAVVLLLGTRKTERLYLLDKRGGVKKKRTRFF